MTAKASAIAQSISVSAVAVAGSGPARASLLQRKCACGGAPGPAGDCVDCRRRGRFDREARGRPLQAKLRVNQPGDRYEHEADRVAEQVMRMPLPSREDARRQSPAMLTMQRRTDSATGDLTEAPAEVHGVVRSPGQPLDPATRSSMEQRFGHDFSQVRVHHDGAAGRSARMVNASAYTVGNHIVFGNGQLQPQASDGRRLLAHELTHVVQQGAAAASTGAKLQRKLFIEDTKPANPAGPSLQAAVERLAGRPVVQSVAGVSLGGNQAAGGSPTLAGFITRAIESAQTYRLRWSTAVPAAGATPAIAGTVDQKDGEIIVAIDRSQIGELTFALDELVADKVLEAVTKFDPSAQSAPAAKKSTTGEPLPAAPEDELLSKPLTITAENQGEKQDRIRAYVDQKLTHLTPAQRRLVYDAGWRGEGVPLTEIIRGVETNTPFRMKQKIEGGRVTATYVDPRTLPATADKLDTIAFNRVLDGMSRLVTFLPGADEATAAAAKLPKTGATCSADEATERTNSCCGPDMLAEFGGHLSTAQAAINRTIQRIEGKELIDCQVRKHFGSQGSETGLVQIAERLRLAQTELFISRHGWKCRPKGSGQLGCDRRTLKGNEGFVGGSVKYDETDILICVNQDAPYTTWTTILHEVMHRVGVHGDETYQGDPAYPGGNPVENADSYAGLVEILGSSSWSPCKPWPVEIRGILGSNLGPGFVVGARVETTPLGPGLRVVDWTLGLNFLWSPKFGIVPEAGDDPQNVLARGYIGAETGVRFTLPRSHGALIFDAAAGLGALATGGSSDPDLGLSARVGGRYRFGKELSGPEVGLDLMRLQSLADREKGDWVVGVTAGFHFGRSSERK